MSQYDIIIPAYNEEHRIQRTLDHYLRFFDESVHFTVVLNGCYDHTVDVVQSIARQFPTRVSMMNITEAIGKGGAIRAAWQQSTADWIGFVDADSATAPQEFSKLIAAAAGHDGAIASRFLPTAQIIERVSWLRTLISHLATRLIRLLFQLPYSDTQCGAKLFRRAVITPILPKLSMTDLLFDVELLWWLRHQGRDIVDVPTIWVDQPGSAMLGSNRRLLLMALRAASSLVALRVRLFKAVRPS